MYIYALFLYIMATLATPTPDANGRAAAANATTQACVKANILAMGIALNIMDQNGEVAALAAVKSAVDANNKAAFGTAKTELLALINNGIAIRQTNQMITPTGNGATAGLAVVANAQLEELKLAMSLTGVAATDDPVLATLKKDFMGGIEQNGKNQAAALAGCGAAAAAAAVPSGAPAKPAPAGAKPSAAGGSAPKPKASGAPGAPKPKASQPPAARSARMEALNKAIANRRA